MDFFHNSVLLNCLTQALLLQGIAIFLLQWKYVGISMICYFVCVKRSLPMHTFIRNGNHDFRMLLIAKINLINDRTTILMDRNRVWVCLSGSLLRYVLWLKSEPFLKTEPSDLLRHIWFKRCENMRMSVSYKCYRCQSFSPESQHSDASIVKFNTSWWGTFNGLDFSFELRLF